MSANQHSHFYCQDLNVYLWISTVWVEHMLQAWTKLSAVAEEIQNSGLSSWKVKTFWFVLYKNLILTLKKNKMNKVWCSNSSECSAWGKLINLAKVVAGIWWYRSLNWMVTCRQVFVFPVTGEPSPFLQLAPTRTDFLKLRTISGSLFHFWFLIAYKVPNI